MFRSLNIRFTDREAFAQEYQRNLANGGIFIPTSESFDAREVIEVELDLQFCDRFVTLQAEIVSRGGSSDPNAAGHGVAVQFLVPAEELRDLLGSIVGLAPAPPAPGREKSPRSSRGARISLALRLESSSGIVRGRTLELSASRVVLWTDGPPVPVGDPIRLTLVYPTGGSDFSLGGNVSAHVEREGRVTGLVIDFDATSTNVATEQLDTLRAGVRSRELEAIRGPVATLGLANLLQMFASSSERGTFAVVREGEEGRVAFENGSLRHVAIGPVHGMKALSRLLSWDDGDFYFLPELDPEDAQCDPAPIYGAVLEAVTELDELGRLDLSRLPPAARVSSVPGAAPGPELDKTGAAVLESASAGITVSALLDAIPDSDAAVSQTLLALLEQGLVVIEPEA